jgi:hypothetical protein
LAWRYRVSEQVRDQLPPMQVGESAQVIAPECEDVEDDQACRGPGRGPPSTTKAALKCGEIEPAIDTDHQLTVQHSLSSCSCNAAMK